LGRGGIVVVYLARDVQLLHLKGGKDGMLIYPMIVAHRLIRPP